MRANYLLGSAIIGGAILTLVGNAMHPVVPLFDVNAYAAEAVRSDWGTIHALLVVGIIVLSLGFLEVYGSLRTRGESLYSLIGLFAILFAGVLWTIVLVPDGFASPRIAADYNKATGATQAALGAVLMYSLSNSSSLIVPAFFLDGLGVGFIGGSLVRARLYPRPLGAAGIGVALVIVVGYAVGLYGPYFVGNNLFPLVAAALLVWILVLGAFVVRGEGTARVTAPIPERVA